MRKAAEAVRLVIKNIFFTGFTMQIGLGLFWMAANFVKIQDFASVDTGVYPFLMQLAGRGYAVIYLLQLSAALYAGYRLLKNLYVGGKGICLWGSLALMTLPMAMQCHMALLPYSFICSLTLLEISFAFESAGEKYDSGEKVLWGSLACFSAQCLLWPKYCIPGAVLPLLLILRKLPGMFRKRERMFRGLLLAVCFLAVTAAAYGVEQKEEGSKYNTSGWGWKLMKRVCWPTIWVDRGFLQEESNSVSDTVVWFSAYYPSYMDVYLKPELDAMSSEHADFVMREMIRCAWKIHYPMVVRQIGWDVLGYSVTPVILPLQLAGDAYDSCSGRNYEIMRNETPVLTKYYVKVSCSWFAVSLALMTAGVAMRCIGRFLKIKKSAVYSFLAVALSAGVVVLFFTMQGSGIMDYKYTVWINQLWVILGITAVAGKDEV